MHLAAFSFLVPVVTGTSAALHTALERARVQDDGSGICRPFHRQAQNSAKIMRHCLEHTGLHPALRLLEHNPEGWQIVGQQAPRAARAHQATQGVVNLPQRVFSLGRILPHQAQVRRGKRPLLIRNIARVSLAA